MICSCGGIFEVVRVEQYPDHLSLQERLLYNRVCDVKCMKCNKFLYSQPYDFGKSINEVRKLGNTDE
jgi:hypothetical protein